MHYQAVIFDLDGTLLDTLADLADAMNRVLETKGLPSHPLEAFRYFVGNGARKLVLRALPPEQRGDADVDGCLAAFRTEYGRTWNQRTGPYDGVTDMLTALTKKGIPLAVLTNKPQRFAERCVQEYFTPGTFVEVRGQQEEVPMKPDPAGAYAAAGNLGIQPQACVYLGDSDVDMLTAVNAGMFPVGAAWGFRPEAELDEAGAARIIKHPQELLNLVE